ncbi:MAG: prepilin-type N-terminal cleavage/methylation domain-containing protein [Phycisphaerales bacterium]
MTRGRFNSRAIGRSRGGFTLTELLVVMGVLAILAVLTAVSVTKISRQSRVASAVNTVTSVLGSARALAIKDNAVVVVAFRPSWDINNKQKPQQTEVVVAKWSGESVIFDFNSSTGQKSISDRFYVADEIPPVLLPAGVKVAGPLFEFGFDNNWVTQGDMASIMQGCKESIEYSRMVAVMYGPDGTVVTRNPRSSGGDSKCFIDFNKTDLTPTDNDPQDVNAGLCASSLFQKYWEQDDVSDETNLTIVPFLAVFDDRAARERKTLDWSNSTNMLQELTGPEGYITTNSDRIHFNRYTGITETQGQEQ